MTQQIYFSKYHGLGNDFIVIDAISQRIDVQLVQKKAASLCHRHFGIGADGILLLLESIDCDFKMIIFNSDGTEPEMCGNGIRCLAHFIHENELFSGDVFSIETKAGTILPAILKQAGVFSAVEVDMGMPQHDKAIMDTGQVLQDRVITLSDQTYQVTCVSFGNPHVVMFVESLDLVDSQLGPAIEALFPDGINVEFAEVMSHSQVRVKVWERGAGYTLACGTGACAVVVAGIHKGVLSHCVQVDLPGGMLQIESNQDDQRVLMTGPSVHLYEGHFKL